MAHRNPYVHRSCVSSTCTTCTGAGRVVHPATGCDVRCSDCDGYIETYRSEFAPQTEEVTVKLAQAASAAHDADSHPVVSGKAAA